VKFHFHDGSFELVSQPVETIINEIICEAADDREDYYLEMAKHGASSMPISLAQLSQMRKALFDALVKKADSHLFGRLLTSERAVMRLTQRMIEVMIQSGDFNLLFSFVRGESNFRHFHGIDAMLNKFKDHREIETQLAFDKKDVLRQVRIF